MMRYASTRVGRPLSRIVGRRSLADVPDDAEGNAATLKFEKSVNQITLLGRLGRDAEMRGSHDHPVVVFSMATNSVYKKADGQTVAHVDWHRVSVFKPGLREKIAAHLKKGDRVFVSGTMRYDEYTDSKDNLQRSATILANDILNLTKKYLSPDDGFQD